MHGKFAASVGADFYFVDEKLRWHDRPSSHLRHYVSGVLSALSFPHRAQYSVFLSEGPHLAPVLLKWFHLLKPDQKVVALMGNETLYFLKTGRYSGRTQLLLVKLLQNYDALICEGEMQAQLARELLGAGCPPLYTYFMGIPKERYDTLCQVSPNLGSNEILFIGNGSNRWRAWYKGLDLGVQAIRLCVPQISNIRLTVVGKWNEQTVQEMQPGSDSDGGEHVRFVGLQPNIQDYLAQSGLYLHCGRGDAFPTSVLEAMCAGIVPLVSEWTGARQVVSQVSSELVLPLDANKIAERILWYFGLPPQERQNLSNRCRQVISAYTEEHALAYFAATFTRMLRDFGLPELPPRPA